MLGHNLDGYRNFYCKSTCKMYLFSTCLKIQLNYGSAVPKYAWFANDDHLNPHIRHLLIILTKNKRLRDLDSCRERLRVLLDKMLNTSQQCMLAAQNNCSWRGLERVAQRNCLILEVFKTRLDGALDNLI